MHKRVLVHVVVAVVIVHVVEFWGAFNRMMLGTYYRVMLEGVHAGHGNVFTIVLINDHPHHLVTIPILQESNVFTEAQVSDITR